eukprot:2682529-Amphidinium_carterae.1
MRKHRIYEKVDASECRGRPLDLKWIYTDRGGGDPSKLKVRSRLVCRDIKARKTEAETAAGSDLFSATPPLEAVRALVSMMAWKRHSKR